MKVEPHILAAYAAYERTTHAGWRSDRPYINELETAKAAADCIPALLKHISDQHTELEGIMDEANGLAETEFHAQRVLRNRIAELEKQLATPSLPTPQNS